MKKLALATILVLAVLQTKAETIVAPSQGSLSGPRPDPFFDRSPVRFQQVYDAEPFLSAIPDAASITQVAFSSRYSPSFFSFVTNIQISFSTTTASSSSLNPVFSQNSGPDETVVFGPGFLVLENVTGSETFRSKIAFSSPFLYDPRKGNLLMEVKNFSGTDNFPCGFFVPCPGFDEVSGPQVPASFLLMFSANAQSGFVVANAGLLTEFTFTPVPEPSVLWIGLCAGTTIIWLGFHRKSLAKGSRYVSN